MQKEICCNPKLESITQLIHSIETDDSVKELIAKTDHEGLIVVEAKEVILAESTSESVEESDAKD